MKGVWVMIIWLNVVGGNVWASSPTIWHQGELVLKNGTELKGELNYNWKAEVVQYRQGAVIKAYSPDQINAFAYFDDQQNGIRKFASVAYPVKSGSRRQRILEEVLMGPLPVYRELRLGPDLVKVASLVGYSNDDEQNKDIDNFIYLVSSGDGLIPLDKFYRTIWPKIKKTFDQEMKKYGALVRVEMTGTVGRLRLLQRYNWLAAQVPSLSLSEQDMGGIN